MEASNPTSTNNTEDLLLPPLGWWKSYQDLLLSVLAPSKETTGLFTTNFLSAGTDSSSVDIKRIVENLAILFNNNNNNGNNSSLSISELQHTTASQKDESIAPALTPETAIYLLLSHLSSGGGSGDFGGGRGGGGIVSNPDLVSASTRYSVECKMEAVVSSWIKAAIGISNPQKIVYHETNKRGEIDRIVTVCKAALFRLLNSYLHQNQHPLIPVFYLPEGDDYSDLITSVLSEKWADIINGGGYLSEDEKTRVAAPVIRFVPTVSHSEVMDLNALIDTIDADRQSEHRVLTPCFLYGRCGTEVTGDEDDLTEMRRICDQKFMWLHTEGNLLSMVLANSGSAFLPEVDGVRKVDSFTLNFGKWFGLATPSCQSASLLPTATILLSVDWSTHKAASATSSMMSLNNATPTSPSSSLPNQTSPISTAATTVSSSSKRAKVLAVSVDQNNFLKIEKGSTAASQQSPPSTHFIKSVPLHLTLPFWIFSEIVSSRKCKVRALQAAEMAKSFGAKCLVSSSSTRLMASYKDYEKGTSLVSLVRYNHVEEQGSSSSSLDLDISAYMETMKAKCNYGTKLLYTSIAHDLRSGLKLELVELANGFLFIRYSPMLVSELNPEQQAMKLVPAVRHLAFESQRIHSAIELRSYFEQSVRSIPQLVLISKEVEPIVIQESSSIAEDGFKSSTLSLSSKFMQKSVSSTSSHPRRKDYAEEMFVGLGAIRYVPSFVGDRDSFKQKRMSDLSAPSSPITNTSPSAINPEILEEIERVNIKLANALSASTIELKSWNRLFVKAKLYDEEDFADGVKQQFIGRKASTSAMLKRYSVELWGDHLEDKSNSPTSPTAKSAPVTISSSMKKSPFGNTLASWNNMHSMEYKTCIRIGLDKEPFTKDSIDLLLANVMDIASKLERDGEIMDNVAAIIRKGIKEAERQLKVEADLGRPGLISYIPIVGTVVDWVWGSDEKKVKAKTFTIAGGFSTKAILSASPSEVDSQEWNEDVEESSSSSSTSSHNEEQVNFEESGAEESGGEGGEHFREESAATESQRSFANSSQHNEESDIATDQNGRIGGGYSSAPEDDDIEQEHDSEINAGDQASTSRSISQSASDASLSGSSYTDSQSGSSTSSLVTSNNNNLTTAADAKRRQFADVRADSGREIAEEATN